MLEDVQHIGNGRAERTPGRSGLPLRDDHAPDADTKTELTSVVAEIDEDRRTLATMMAGLDVDPSTVKQIAGFAAERLGRTAGQRLVEGVNRKRRAFDHRRVRRVDH